jgi:hemerythrin-like domain-containing protein
MEKRIQIPASLYEAMVDYIQNHYDPCCKEQYYFIYRGVMNKQEAEIKRNLYSAYKAEKDPDTREMLRQSYLDKAGIPSHGRWTEQAEEEFRKGNFVF